MADSRAYFMASEASFMKHKGWRRRKPQLRTNSYPSVSEKHACSSISAFSGFSSEPGKRLLGEIPAQSLALKSF